MAHSERMKWIHCDLGAVIDYMIALKRAEEWCTKQLNTGMRTIAKKDNNFFADIIYTIIKADLDN